VVPFVYFFCRDLSSFEPRKQRYFGGGSGSTPTCPLNPLELENRGDADQLTRSHARTC
jgi:hypothetical protein